MHNKYITIVFFKIFKIFVYNNISHHIEQVITISNYENQQMKEASGLPMPHMGRPDPEYIKLFSVRISNIHMYHPI